MKTSLLTAALLGGLALLLGAEPPTATSPNSGVRLSHPTPATYEISWWADPARTCFIQGSLNLIDWAYLDIVERPTDAQGYPNPLGQAKTWSIEPLDAWTLLPWSNRFFLRLKTTTQVAAYPALADFDGDGLANGWEVRHGFDPLNAASGGATSDLDEDGASNAVEAARGSDPRLTTTVDPAMQHVQLQIFTPTEP